jgi:serine/threonine protein kinase
MPIMSSTPEASSHPFPNARPEQPATPIREPVVGNGRMETAVDPRRLGEGEHAMSGTLLRVDEICDRFETAWQAGQQPRIEDYLGDLPEPERPLLLRELLRLELAYRRRNSEIPLVGDYVKRFQEYAEQVEAVFREEPLGRSRENVKLGPPVDPLFGPLPRTFGRYVIRKRLGKGGMGAVYLADDTQLERPVALKVALFQGDEGSSFAQRFQREAKAAAGLRHEGICRVLDCDETDGIHFFTMEYVPGKPLSQVLEESGPLDPLRAAVLTARVAEALAVAHRAGVDHRDQKPANVMLDDTGRPIVVDFGLARRQQDLSLTLTGDVLGTPKYMSPEQINGQEVGPASDVYSLGATLYHLLTGQPPFEAATMTQLAHRIAHEPPEPPSRHRPGIDPGLEAICLKALAKAPADRFASMDEMAAALQRYLSGAPTEPVFPKPPAPSRRRRMVVLAALLLLTGAVAVGFAVWHGKQRNSGAGEPPPPFNGSVDVLVWKKDVGRAFHLDAAGGAVGCSTLVWKKDVGRAFHLRDEEALPLTLEDEIAVEVELNRPAYLYVIWINPEGEALPIYPWKKGNWDQRPAEEKPLDRLRRPDAPIFWGLKQNWSVGAAVGPPINLVKVLSGMETLLLLVREEPWPAGVDLRQLMAGLPKQAMQNPVAAVWFEDWQVVHGEPTREPNVFDERRHEDPVMKTQRLLRERLGSLCSYSRAVSFANQGR